MKSVQMVGFPIVMCGYFIWREVRYKDTMSQNLVRLTEINTIMIRALTRLITIPEGDMEKMQKLLSDGDKT